MRWPSYRVLPTRVIESDAAERRQTRTDSAYPLIPYVYRFFPTVLKNDIAITKPICLLNRAIIMVSRQRVQCYDAPDNTAFWRSAEEYALGLIVR